MATEMEGDARLGGRWLRRLRESQGLTQRELEKKTGISYATISQLEIGAIAKPSLGVLTALGRALGFDPNEAAQRYGMWLPETPEQQVEPEEFTFAKNVLKRLSPGQRYSFLMSIESLARAMEQQIEK